MSEQAIETTPAPVTHTGSPSLDERLAAAAEAIGIEDDEALPPAPKVEPKAEEAPQDAEEATDDAEAKADGKDEPKAKPKGKDNEKPKTRNQIRDLAAEWATARRAQQANLKRAQELEERARQVEAEQATAREVAQLMGRDPIQAVERLAKLANMTPSQYLERLQHAYIHGDEPQRRADDPVTRELAEVRQELERMRAERQKAEVEAQQAAYQQQLAQVAQHETQLCSELASSYAEEFPDLAALSPEAMQRQVSDAVNWFLSNGYQVGRFEVLQAANNVVRKTLDEMGVAGRLTARAASAPAATAEKSRRAAPQPRNGSNGRYIPTAAAAAESSAPRRMTVEERLREAEKLLWASE
jgi:Skp family chaperone for outer membrane proteins